MQTSWADSVCKSEEKDQPPPPPRRNNFTYVPPHLRVRSPVSAGPDHAPSGPSDTCGAPGRGRDGDGFFNNGGGRGGRGRDADGSFHNAGGRGGVGRGGNGHFYYGGGRVGGGGREANACFYNGDAGTREGSGSSYNGGGRGREANGSFYNGGGRSREPNGPFYNGGGHGGGSWDANNGNGPFCNGDGWDTNGSFFNGGGGGGRDTDVPFYNGGGRGGGGGWKRTGSWDRGRDRDREVNPFTKEENDETTGINFDAYEDIPVETNGNNVPPPVTAFAEIDLGAALNENIRKCKFVKPTPVQRYALPISLAGRDLMACAQTGSGKTAAFCFPIICGIMKGPSVQRPQQGLRLACPLGLILSPTRELSCQIHEEVRKFSYQTGVRVSVVYGGAPINQQLWELEKGVDILVATPGRLVDLGERNKVSLQMIKYLALDEADRMLDMGFEPQIRRIVQAMGMPPPDARQTMLFSATFPKDIQRLASDFLSKYIFLAVGRVGSSTDLIAQRVEYVQTHEKRSHLMDLLHAQRSNVAHAKQALTLVFVETKKGADSLEHWLCANGFPATTIHGDRTQHEREHALRSFKTGATPIMVATDVAARGLDIPHVAHVVNFDLPKDIDDYVHRIGRTGRAGKTGLATAFFNENNGTMAKPLCELMLEANQEVPVWLSQHAARSSTNRGGGGGKSRRPSVGGPRFGGRDFRSGGNGNIANGSAGLSAWD